MYTLYWRLIMPDIYLLTVAFVSGIAGAAVQAYTPTLYASAISHSLSADQKKDLSAILFKLIVANVVVTALTSIRGGLFTFLQARLHARLAPYAFNQFIRGRYEKKDETTYQVLTDDVSVVSENISTQLNVLSRSLAGLLVTLIMLFRASILLTFLSIAIIPINLIISNSYNQIYERIAESRREEERKLISFTQECVNDFITIKTLDRSDGFMANKYSTYIGNLYRTKVLEAKTYMIQVIITNNLPHIFTFILIMTASQLVMKGRLNGGELLRFMLYQPQMYELARTILDIYGKFPHFKTKLKSVINLLTPSMESKGLNRHRRIERDMSFNEQLLDIQNVSFRYSDNTQWVLQDFNLQLFRGDVMALTGPNGCGKSTLIKLIMVLQPQMGRIIYKPGIKISAVMQEPALFSGTIRENILLGYKDDEQTLKWALLLAHATEFVSKMPLGLNSPCNSNTLSGGQKQRLAIARAILRNPDILVFDEPTSALDKDSSANIMITLKAFKNSGVLLIAHHQETLSFANRIKTF